MKRFNNKITANIACAMIAVFSLIGINELAYDRSVAAMDALSTTEVTRNSLQRLLQDVLDAETGQRGYLLSDDPQYLEPYNAAIADIGQTQDVLRNLFIDKPDEFATLSILSRTVQQKLTEMDLSLRMKREGKDDAWKFVLTTDLGKEQMDTIRSSASTLIAASQKRRDASYAEIRKSLLAARLGITLVTAVGFVAFALYLRQTAALKLADQRQQLALQSERDLLGIQVRERTERLAELATHLQEVREDERAHLARELHDELGALLTAAKLDVARIKARLGNDTIELQQRIQHLVETLNSGIALKRRIIEDLRPSSLSNLGLLPSLEILTREFERRSGLVMSTNLEAVILDEPAQLTVYRLVQESLTNIAKYAQARHVNISLLNYPGHVVVKVQDDGCGFDPLNEKNSGHGLAGMRHRVEALGGRLTIESVPEGMEAKAGTTGTTVSAVLAVGNGLKAGIPDDANFA
ncbi:MAG: histidine kinase [Comamonadaceae bacterium]|nr:MAG: histidine kinase [Comamonadaceae bacterium]